MNRFTLHKNGIIADKKAYEQLHTAERASLLLLSDTHGAVDAVRWIFTAVHDTCDACLFSGDGAEDIIGLAEQAASGADGCPSVPPVLIFAQGNCDCERYRFMKTGGEQERTSFFQIPPYQHIEIAHQRILLTHGHLCRVEFDIDRLRRIAESSKCAIAIHGHTHIQAVDFLRSVTVINGGSPMRPRGKSHGGFAVITIDNEAQSGELFFYKLTKTADGSFSASVTATYELPLGGKQEQTE